VPHGPQELRAATGTVVVAGEALVDLVMAADGTLTPAAGGGPFNVARTIARLGRSATLYASISTDRFGEQLVAELDDAGVCTELLQRVDVPTTIAVAELDRHGGATYRFYLDGTASPSLAPTERLAAVLPGTLAAVHVGTLALVLEPMATTVVELVESLPDSVLVMVDPNYRERVVVDRAAYLDRLDRVLRRAHIVKVSTDDVELLAPGMPPLAYAQGLVDDGVDVVLVTDGGSASHVVTAYGHTELATPSVTVADTIGAGDSFGGGFLTAWLDGGGDVDSVRSPSVHQRAVAAATAAQQVAAITVQRTGAEPPWRHELPADWGVAASAE
jgi:fructokinase